MKSGKNAHGDGRAPRVSSTKGSQVKRADAAGRGNTSHGGHTASRGNEARVYDAPRDRPDRPERDERDERYRDTDFIEGKHAVLEALETGTSLSCVLMRESPESNDDLKRIESLAEASNVPVRHIARHALDEMSERGAHQGVMAQVAPFSYVSVEELLRAAGTDDALVIVLDHLTDAGNFGTIIRSAEVVGATGIIIPRRRSVSVTPSTYKTSAGAVSRVKIAMATNLANALSALKGAGFWIVGASEKADDLCWDAEMAGRIGLVMGSEGEGLSRLVEQNCDLLVSLPQHGAIGSLNVAQATTALSYEWMRQSRAERLGRDALTKPDAP